MDIKLDEKEVIVILDALVEALARYGGELWI